ncbi:MAG: sulfurtransferase complex subunit TusC [Methylococcales bacterium]|nr:sulfurtransferase complex subunit TusC [Methylococcales bacterium]
MKKYLFVLRKSAHSGTSLQETLDVILTTAAFDQQVAILLLDDAVFQLKEDQKVSYSKSKDTCAIFNALALYDVKELYIEEESMLERGINITNLTLSVEIVKRAEVENLYQSFDIIYSA